MLQVVKKPKESNEKLIGRFTKQVQGSRILNIAKEGMYFSKPLKKGSIRKRAIKREYYRGLQEKRKYL